MIRNILLCNRRALYGSTVVAQKISNRYMSSVPKHHKFNDVELKKYFLHTQDDGFIRTSPHDSVTIPETTIDKYVWADYLQWQNKTAIVCAITNRQYTYSQLRDHCAAFAVHLQTKFNLKQGDTIAICLPNIPEFAIAILGAIEAGIIVTTVNPIYTADEISKQIISSGAKLIIGTVKGHPVIQNATKTIKKPINIIAIKTDKNDILPSKAIDFFEMIQTKDVDFSVLNNIDMKPDQLAVLPYSSGTTGLPKGVMLNHRNITGNCTQMQTALPFEPYILPTTNDFQEVIPSVLPFFHIYGFTILLVSKLSLGTKVVSLPSFQPDTFLKSIVEHKGTVLHLVPPIILFLGSHKSVEKKHLATVRNVMSGAAPIGQLDAERLVNRFHKIDFVQGYGLTETSPAVFLNNQNTTNYASVGYLLPNTDAKVVDINDKQYKGLGPDQRGEIVLRGPQTMMGYLNNKEANDDTIVNDNWVRTGDMGYYDENGCFFITDRLKELIKVKGFQVPPAELEEILRDHPKVSDAAVIGIPHDKHGEVPRAFIVKHEGVDITEKELKDYVASKVATYKQLDGGVTFLSTIPKNASGKIMRREIKSKYC